jgi:prophage tail gpP-like protein
MIKVLVNGKTYTAFQSIILTAGYNELCRSFTMQTYEDLSSYIKIQDKIEIFIDNDKFLTGYIEGFASEVDSNRSTLSFDGRSLTADLVDCNPEIDGSYFKNKNYKDVVSSIIAKFGIKLKTSIDTKVIKYTAINQGETCLDYLNRITAKYGYILTTNADGDLVIENKSTGSLKGTLHWESSRINRATRSSNYANRFSKYICKSQEQNTTTQGVFEDVGIKRYRPKVITEEGVGTSPTERARNEALRSTGEAIKVAIQYKGHRLENTNELFEIGKEIYIYYPKLRIDQKMLIESVSFSQDETQGITSDINFVDPRAYYGEKPRVNKSDKELKELISVK